MMSDYQTIDIRDWKQQHADLKTEIVNAVKSTQSVVVRPLPDKLVMTPIQYDMLQQDPEMQGMYESNQHVYVTSENAMEVIIQEP
jgi:hypothetical protein